MSINLWKTGGMATSYNTLPSGLITLNLKYGCDLQVKFKAKSPTGKKLKVWVSGQPSNTDMVTLTSDFKDYVISKPAPNYQLQFYFSEENQLANDIIITDIQLVQKPLPKLTINGIDGFKSGKWTNQGSVIVTDDETLVLNATASNQGSLLKIPCEPSTQYYFKGEGNYYVQSLNSASAWLVDHLANKSEGGFTTHASAKFIQIILWNSSAGQFTFKRPQLNLGTIPAPYEKKRGDKMVLPIAKGNLFDGALNSDYSINGTTGNLLTTTGWSATPNYMPCKPSVTYTITKTAYSYVYYYDSAKTFLGTGTRSDLGTGTKSFTTPLNAYYMRFNINSLTETQIQLNEGTTAQPYKPYAVQMNKKPLRYVPKKNLFDKNSVTKGYALTSGGAQPVVNANFSYSDYIKIKPSTSYSRTNNNGGEFYDANKVFVVGFGAGTPIVTPPNGYYMRANVALVDLDTAQFEEGTTATTYEPYQLVLPKTKTGLSFNGVTDYLQLPSMAMDSVEIDCLIDSVQGSGFHNIVDARSGLASGFFSLNGETSTPTNSVWSYTGWVGKGVRQKLKLTSVSPFTDNVNVFGSYLNNEFTKGTLYKVTCYLAGQVVASYDFTNPSTIVGNTVLQKAKNLIPSFEDARWSLHANTQVLGKDVLRLNATATSQESRIDLPIVGGNSYLFSMPYNGNNVIVEYLDINRTNVGYPLNSVSSPIQYILPTASSNVYYVRVRLRSSTIVGQIDFIRPQLYQLDGKEGTLNGTPKQINKASKRKLYSKR